MEPEGEIADVEIVPTRHQKEVTAALARMVLWTTCSAAAQ